jgi:hypothetical protein
MKNIDFLYKNFDIDFFLKNIENNQKEETLIQDAVFNSIKDLQSLKARLSYYKYYIGKDQNIFTEFIKIYKENYTDKDIENFFRKKGQINTYSKNFIDEEVSFEFRDLVKSLVNTGEFFRKLDKFFKITFYALLTRNDYPNASWEDVYLLYSYKDKIYRLCIFFFEEDGNDHEYVYKKFKQQPSNDDLLKVLKKKGLQFAPQKNTIVTLSKPFQFNSYWKKTHKNALLIEHKDEKIFKDEKEFLRNCDDNQSIFYYLNKDPEKYYKVIRPEKHKSNDKRVSLAFLNNKIKSSSQEAQFIIRLFSEYWKNNPREKVNNNNFFKYLMSPKLNWYNDKLLIMDLIYKCNDLDGFTALINPKFLDDKLLIEEIRILKLFRNKSKDFIMKVFKKNKQMLNDLFANYVPDYVKNNSSIMNDILKIDINLMRYIGEKLKENKVFMSKVDQMVKSK